MMKLDDSDDTVRNIDEDHEGEAIMNEESREHEDDVDTESKYNVQFVLKCSYFQGWNHLT